MKPVPQTILYGEHTTGNGNCVDACLASLLEFPLWMVPPFYEMWGRKDRFKRLDQWLLLFGLDLEFLDDPDQNSDALPEFYMVTGTSPRNPATGHAVIYGPGKVLAHDPHYSGLGIIGTPTSVRYLVAHDAAKVHPAIPRTSYVTSPL